MPGLGPIYLQGTPPEGSPGVSTDGAPITGDQNQVNLEALALLAADVAPIDISGNAATATEALGPAASTSTAGLAVLAADGGTTPGTVVQATDARLSDARAPLAHLHDAADTDSGVFAAARLGTGSANSSTVLCGDSVWREPSGGGGGGSSPYDPLTRPSLRMWLRATDIRAVDGDLLDTVYDRSGRGRAMAAAGDNRPTFRGGAVPNGRAAIYFPTSTQYLQGAAPGNAVADASSWDFTVVFQATSAESAAGTVYQNPAIVVHEGLFFGLFICDVGGGDIRLKAYNWHGGAQEVSVACSLNAFHVASIRLSGGTLGLSLDGGAEVTVASGTTDDVSGHLRIGTPAKTSAGLYVAELLTDSPAYSTTDLSSYLKTYYGIS